MTDTDIRDWQSYTLTGILTDCQCGHPECFTNRAQGMFLLLFDLGNEFEVTHYCSRN